MRLTGKVAVVTGAARGIGQEYAKMLASEGASLVLLDINDCADTRRIVEAQSAKCMTAHGDITDASVLKTMIRDAVNCFGTIHILINNAAILSPLSVMSMNDIRLEEFDEIMRVNVRGTFQCVREVAPYMIENQYGKIVNISSTTAMVGHPMVHYVASKAAVNAMSYCFARELGNHNICVNTLVVGLTESDAVTEQECENNALLGKIRENVVSQRLIKKKITAEEMANVMLFLASPESDCITGETLVADAGFVFH